MPKRVAVIDLGSNSARMAIFERTSRLGFYILREFKTKVRLGEGAYEHGGVLQKAAMDKVFAAFAEFREFIRLYGVRKVICAGTSALRDAPNGDVFIARVSRELGLNLRVIDGKTEAFLGGIAALNLLSPFGEATTIDIGGGSTELARIKDGRIVETLSLDLGTVRLKELFFDKKDPAGAAKFADKLIATIPESFRNSNLIAIGGSARAISSAIMQLKNHPLKLVHNYIYDFAEQRKFIEKLAYAGVLELKNFPVKKDRYDTIREGAMIFAKVCAALGGKLVFTSGAGVREGLFLSSLLRPGVKFPQNFNPSVKSLTDRFAVRQNSLIVSHARAIFAALSPLHGLDEKYLRSLVIAAKLCNLGRSLGFYSEQSHSAYIVRGGLNYGFTHEERALIAAIIENAGRENVDFGPCAPLLPNAKIVRWLSFMLAAARWLSVCPQARFEFLERALHISGAKNFVMVKENVKKLPKPEIFAVTFD